MKTKAKSAKYYIIRFSPNGPPDIFEEMKDIEFLIQSFVDIVKKQFQSKDVVLNLYVFQLICQMLEDKSLNANISLIVRKNYMQKGKKESYAQMEPAMKKKVLSDKAIWCKSLDPVEKEKLLSHRAEWYKSLDPKEKEKLLSKSADWYKLLGSAEKQNLLSSRAIWYKSLDTAQKQKRANGLTC